ncbi:MAG: hypothetical protein KC416_04755 [Myxococcales bacterium]|nr:hypothetical protein [Myxococcales bacterium]
MFRAAAVSIVLFLLAGCSTSLTSFTPAQTTPGGHVRVSAAVGVNTGAGDMVDRIDEGSARAEQFQTGQRTPTQMDAADFVDLAAALVVNPATVGSDLQLRVGILDAWDFGVRVSNGTLRGDTRIQFLGREACDDVFFGSIGVGFGAYAFGFDVPVPGAYEDFVTLEDIERYEFDGSLLFGWSGSVGDVWFGPKVVYTTYSTTAKVALSPVPTVTAQITGSNIYYGGQVGLALNLYIFRLAAELTIAGVSASAEANSSGSTSDQSTDGLVIYPAAGVMFEF